MRISNRNMYMSQIRNMDVTLNNLTNSNNRLTSGRKFTQAYEDVAAATKAMRLRKSLRDKDFYMDNIRDTRGRLNSADDALQTSVKVLRDVQDGLTQALNGTYDEKDRGIIAGEVENLQKEVLALMNSSYTDHFVFGATGGPTKGEAPFTIGQPKIPQTVDGATFYSYTADPAKQQLYDADGNVVTDVGRTSEMKMPLTLYKKDPTNLAGGEVAADFAVNLLTTADFDDYFIGKEFKNVTVQKMDYTYATDGTTVIDENPAPAVLGDTQLLYHGMPVDDMEYAVVNGKATGDIVWYNYDQKTGLVKNDLLTGSGSTIPYNGTNYIDIGLGHKMQNTATGEKINPETVMQYTYSGVEVFGLGKADNGLSNNLYSFMGQVVDALRTDDTAGLESMLNHVSSVRSTLLTSLTDIGVRSNFLDDMEGIHTNDKLNYQTRQTDIEAVDLPEETMYNKNHEMAWMVTLQMGGKMLPSTLFDFLR